MTNATVVARLHGCGGVDPHDAGPREPHAEMLSFRAAEPTEEVIRGNGQFVHRYFATEIEFVAGRSESTDRPTRRRRSVNLVR